MCNLSFYWDDNFVFFIAYVYIYIYKICQLDCFEILQFSFMADRSMQMALPQSVAAPRQFLGAHHRFPFSIGWLIEGYHQQSIGR